MREHGTLEIQLILLENQLTSSLQTCRHLVMLMFETLFQKKCLNNY